MESLRKGLAFGALTILTITASTRFSDKIPEKPFVQQKVVYRFSELERCVIKDFELYYGEIICWRLKGNPDKTENLMNKMLDRYLHLSPEIQKEVKDYIEGAWFF